LQGFLAVEASAVAMEDHAAPPDNIFRLRLDLRAREKRDYRSELSFTRRRSRCGHSHRWRMKIYSDGAVDAAKMDRAIADPLGVDHETVNKDAPGESRHAAPARPREKGRAVANGRRQARRHPYQPTRPAGGKARPGWIAPCDSTQDKSSCRKLCAEARRTTRADQFGRADVFSGR